MTLYRIFGYAGALPFLGMAVALHVTSDPLFKEALGIVQLCYGGMIVSFLAGVHWSHALPRDNPSQIFAAMQPTIFSLFLIVMAFLSGGYGVILALLAIGFIGLYILDLKMLEKAWLPEGYFCFRKKITVIVSASLVISGSAFWI